MDNAKKKVAPCNSLNFPKKLKFKHWYLGPKNVFFQNVHFRGLVWYLLNSWKTRASRGLDKPADSLPQFCGFYSITLRIYFMTLTIQYFNLVDSRLQPCGFPSIALRIHFHNPLDSLPQPCGFTSINLRINFNNPVDSLSKAPVDVCLSIHWWFILI